MLFVLFTVFVVVSVIAAVDVLFLLTQFTKMLIIDYLSENASERHSVNNVDNLGNFL